MQRSRLFLSYLPRKFCELGPVAADDPLAEVVVVDGRADPALGLLTTVITFVSLPPRVSCISTYEGKRVGKGLGNTFF